MDASSYIKELASKGLGYLKDLSIRDMVALDIETTGLTPDHSQVTQVAMLSVHNKSAVVCSKCRLTSTTLVRLGAEAAKPAVALRKGSTHWVLRYNNYHPVFKKFGDFLLDKSCSHKLATMTARGLMYHEPDTEVPLQQEGLRSLAGGSFNPLDENGLLLRMFARLRMLAPGTKLLGQNILGFDIPFLEGRAKVYGINPWFPPAAADTMWISRILLIPALEVLAPLDHRSKEILQKLTTAGGKVSSSLQDLVHALGATGSQAHDAMGDCRTTVEVLRAMQCYAAHADALLAADADLNTGLWLRIANAATKPPIR